MKRVTSLAGSVAIVTTLIVANVRPASANTTSFGDGDFSTNWSAVQFGTTGSISAARVSAGGNPGAYWSVTNNVDTTNISAVSMRSDFTFTPSISGAIQDISVSYDAITQISGQGQGTAPALLQNGKLYESQPENTGYYTSFTSLSFAALHADSFLAIDGSGMHPDFSAAGPTIVFGFANSNSGTGAFSHRTTHSDFDNFNATINFTPSLLGDYNQDGVVDAADYTVWRDTLGSKTDLRADGDRDGTIGTGDYNVWKTNFGQHVAQGAGADSLRAIPEPSTLANLLTGIFVEIVSIAASARQLAKCERSCLAIDMASEMNAQTTERHKAEGSGMARAKRLLAGIESSASRQTV
jgi:hypothetical protein